MLTRRLGASALSRRRGVLSRGALAARGAALAGRSAGGQRGDGRDAGIVEVIGQLTPLTTTRSPALVHCFVGYFARPAPEGLAVRLRPGRSRQGFWVPLARLADTGVYHEELWPAGPGAGTSAPERRRPPSSGAVPFFRLEEDVVWGATGRLLTELLDAVLVHRGRRPRRLVALRRYPGGVMICPRCGVTTSSGQAASCTRCSGSLGPSPARNDRRPPPGVPVTNRAEADAAPRRSAVPSRAGPPAALHGRARLTFAAAGDRAGVPPAGDLPAGDGTVDGPAGAARTALGRPEPSRTLGERRATDGYRSCRGPDTDRRLLRPPRGWPGSGPGAGTTVRSALAVAPACDSGPPRLGPTAPYEAYER